MSKLTKESIEELLLKYQGIDGQDTEDLDVEYWSCISEIEDNEVNINIDDEHGGYEGAGEDQWFVLKIALLTDTDEDIVYVRFNGCYNSWNGTEWENIDFDIVQPEEYIAIKWVKVKE